MKEGKMFQKQCPNCGGYKIQKTGDMFETVPLSNENKIKNIIINQVIYWVAMFFLGIVPIILMENVSSATKTVLVLLIFMGAIVVALLIFFFVKTTKKRIGEQYYCNLCGFRWDWYFEKPWPLVSKRPDLINLGSERLEEEKRQQQEKLRKEQEAWFIINQQQNKNK